jgi:hypothetical protein
MGSPNAWASPLAHGHANAQARKRSWPPGHGNELDLIFCDGIERKQALQGGQEPFTRAKLCGEEHLTDELIFPAEAEASVLVARLDAEYHHRFAEIIQ